MMSMLNNAPMCSAWMNFMSSPADFAEEFLSAVSRNGSSNTSRGEPRRPQSHEPIPSRSESHSSSRAKRAGEKWFKVLLLTGLFS